MKKIILLLAGVLFFSGIAFAEQKDIFLISLIFENENISIRSITVTEANFQEPVRRQYDTYSINLFSCNSEKLYSQKFSFPTKAFFEPDPEWFDQNGNQIFYPKEGEVAKVLKRTKELIVPFFGNVGKIIITDKDQKEILALEKGFKTDCGLDLSPENPPVVELKDNPYQQLPIFLVLLLVVTISMGGLIYLLKNKKEQ